MGMHSFQKNATFLRSFAFFIKKTWRSLRSFAFFFAIYIYIYTYIYLYISKYIYIYLYISISIYIFIYIIIYILKKRTRVGHAFFCNRTLGSLRSFTFFAKEPCVLLHSLQKNVAFFAFFYVLKKRTQKNASFFWVS